MTPQARAAATRTNLLMGAARAFARRGYTATTTNDILQEAGATKGSLYFHFASKEDIAVALTRLQYDSWPPRIEEIRKQATSPLDALLDIVDMVVHRFQHDVVVRAGVRLNLERDLVSDQMPAPFLGWEDLICGVLAEAQGQGQIRPSVDVEVESRVLVSAFFGIQHRSLVLTGQRDLPQRFAEFWVRWLPAISADDTVTGRAQAHARSLLGRS